MESCKTCSQPIDVCREQDKKLIKPFHGDYRIMSITSTNDYCKTRYMRAFLYTKGCYDPVTERFYLQEGYTYNLPKHAKDLLKLPLCVWENKYDKWERLDYVKTHLEQSLNDIGLQPDDIFAVSDLSYKYLETQLFQSNDFV